MTKLILPKTDIVVQSLRAREALNRTRLFLRKLYCSHEDYKGKNIHAALTVALNKQLIHSDHTDIAQFVTGDAAKMLIEHGNQNAHKLTLDDLKQTTTVYPDVSLVTFFLEFNNLLDIE
jgi:hypothetical protein